MPNDKKDNDFVFAFSQKSNIECDGDETCFDKINGTEKYGKIYP